MNHLRRLSSQNFSRSRPPGGSLQPLTRKEFYALADQCREWALELARYDQHRVDLRRCHEFNAWLARLKRYEPLAPELRSLRPARPIARWQVMVIAGVAGLILISLPGLRMGRSNGSFAFYGYVLSMIVFYFVPERYYGTTIELLEGKVLRIVEVLEELLMSGAMEFSQAAFFQVRDNLRTARRELRQQIDLAHRRL